MLWSFNSFSESPSLANIFGVSFYLIVNCVFSSRFFRRNRGFQLNYRQHPCAWFPPEVVVFNKSCGVHQKLHYSRKSRVLTKKSLSAHQDTKKSCSAHQKKVGLLTKNVSAWSPNIGAQQKGFCQSSKIFLCLPKNSLQLKAFLLKMHLESSRESILRYHLVAVIEVFEAQIHCYLNFSYCAIFIVIVIVIFIQN